MINSWLCYLGFSSQPLVWLAQSREEHGVFGALERSRASLLTGPDIELYFTEQVLVLVVVADLPSTAEEVSLCQEFTKFSFSLSDFFFAEGLAVLGDIVLIQLEKRGVGELGAVEVKISLQELSLVDAQLVHNMPVHRVISTDSASILLNLVKIRQRGQL
jgi:hypothetical protein